MPPAEALPLDQSTPPAASPYPVVAPSAQPPKNVIQHDFHEPEKSAVTSFKEPEPALRLDQSSSVVSSPYPVDVSHVKPFTPITGGGSTDASVPPFEAAPQSAPITPPLPDEPLPSQKSMEDMAANPLGIPDEAVNSIIQKAHQVGQQGPRPQIVPPTDPVVPSLTTQDKSESFQAKESELTQKLQGLTDPDSPEAKAIKEQLKANEAQQTSGGFQEPELQKQETSFVEPEKSGQTAGFTEPEKTFLQTISGPESVWRRQNADLDAQIAPYGGDPETIQNAYHGGAIDDLNDYLQKVQYARDKKQYDFLSNQFESSDYVQQLLHFNQSGDWLKTVEDTKNAVKWAGNFLHGAWQTAANPMAIPSQIFGAAGNLMDVAAPSTEGTTPLKPLKTGLQINPSAVAQTGNATDIVTGGPGTGGGGIPKTDRTKETSTEQAIDERRQASMTAAVAGVESANADTVEWGTRAISHLIGLTSTAPNALLKLAGGPVFGGDPDTGYVQKPAVYAGKASKGTEANIQEGIKKGYITPEGQSTVSVPAYPTAKEVGYISPEQQLWWGFVPDTKVLIRSAKSVYDMDPHELAADALVGRAQAMSQAARDQGYVSLGGQHFLNTWAGKSVNTPEELIQSGHPVPLKAIQDTRGAVGLAEAGAGFGVLNIMGEASGINSILNHSVRTSMKLASEGAENFAANLDAMNAPKWVSPVAKFVVNKAIGAAVGHLVGSEFTRLTGYPVPFSELIGSALSGNHLFKMPLQERIVDLAGKGPGFLSKLTSALASNTSDALGLAAQEPDNMLRSAGALKQIWATGIKRVAEGAGASAIPAALGSQTPEEAGSLMALGVGAHVIGHALPDLRDLIQSRAIDSAFVSPLNRYNNRAPAADPIPYKTHTALDQAHADAMASVDPTNGNPIVSNAQKHLINDIRTQAGDMAEVYVLNPKPYASELQRMRDNGYMNHPDMNSRGVAIDPNPALNKARILIRSDSIDSATHHELAHAAVNRIAINNPDDLDTMFRAASKKTDPNDFSRNYTSAISQGTVNASFDDLPSQASINDRTGKYVSGLEGLTKEDMKKEMAAEAIGGLLKGGSVRDLTRDPTLLHQTQQAFWRFLDGLGFDPASIRTISPLGLNPSVPGAMILEPLVRDTLRRNKGIGVNAPPIVDTAIPKSKTTSIAPETSKVSPKTPEGATTTSETPTPVTTPIKYEPTPVNEDAVKALQGLGWVKKEAQTAIASAKGETVGEKLGNALRALKNKPPVTEEIQTPEVKPAKQTPAQIAYDGLVNSQKFDPAEVNKHLDPNATNPLQEVHRVRQLIVNERRAAGIPIPGEKNVIHAPDGGKLEGGPRLPDELGPEHDVSKKAKPEEKTPEGQNKPGFMPAEIKAEPEPVSEKENVAGTITGMPDGTWHLNIGDQGHVRVFRSEAGAKNAAKILSDQYGPSLLHPDDVAAIQKAAQAAQKSKQAQEAKNAPPVIPVAPPTAEKKSAQKKKPAGPTLPTVVPPSAPAPIVPTAAPQPAPVLQSQAAVPPIPEQQTEPVTPPAPPKEATPQVETDENSARVQKALRAEGVPAGQAQAATFGKTPRAHRVYSRIGRGPEVREEAKTPRIEGMQHAGQVAPGSAEQFNGHLGGVLAGKGQAFIDAGQKYGVDPRLLASISMFETGNGTSRAAREFNNAGGMMDPHSPDAKGFMSFGSVEEGIDAMAANLRRNYIDKGLTDIDSIARKYSPVGAANDPHGTNAEWPASVRAMYQRLGGDPEKGLWTSGVTAVPSLAGVTPPSEMSKAPETPRLPLAPRGAETIAAEEPVSTAGSLSPEAQSEYLYRPTVTPQSIASTGEEIRNATPQGRKSDKSYADMIVQKVIESVGLQHSEGLAPDDTRVRFNADSGWISGTHFVPDDAFHNWLLRGQSPQVMEMIRQLQDEIQKRSDLSLTYKSAPQEEKGLATNVQRKEAQAESTAENRAKGIAPVQEAAKNMIPSSFSVTPGKGGEPNTVMVHGMSPDKLSANSAMIQHRLGPESPYKPGPIGDSIAEEDMRGAMSNWANGWPADGSARLKPVEGVTVPEESPDFEPYEMGKVRSNFWNLAVNGGSKLSPKEMAKGVKTPSGRAALLAQENAGFLTPGGFVNPLHQKIESETPGWSKQHLHSGYEALRIDNIKKIHEIGEPEAPPIHPQHQTVARAMQEQALAPAAIIKAGFLPAELPKEPKETIGEEKTATPILPLQDQLKKNEHLRDQLEKQQSKLDTTNPEEDKKWNDLASKIHDLEDEHDRMSMGSVSHFMPGQLLANDITGEQDRVEAAAIRHKGNIYTGNSHYAAKVLADRDVGERIKKGTFDEGYTTMPSEDNPEGRYVSRREGWNIASQAGQLREGARPLEESQLYKGQKTMTGGKMEGLRSEDLNLSKPMFMPDDRIVNPAGEKETIARPGAAIRYNGVNYVAPMHLMAYADADEANGFEIPREERYDVPEGHPKYGHPLPESPTQEGFMTTTGRFIGRDEGWHLAPRAKQVRSGAQQLEQSKLQGTSTGLRSQDLVRSAFMPGETPKEETTRLYRAQAAPNGKVVPEWIKQGQDESGHTEAQGRWFTSDPELLKWYQEDAGNNASIQHVDIPTSYLDKYRVANSKETIKGRKVASFSRDPENEFFLPRELAETRKSISPKSKGLGQVSPEESAFNLGERTYTNNVGAPVRVTADQDASPAPGEWMTYSNNVAARAGMTPEERAANPPYNPSSKGYIDPTKAWFMPGEDTVPVTTKLTKNGEETTVRVPYDITRSPLISDKQPKDITKDSPDNLPKDQFQYLNTTARKKLTALDEASATGTFAKKIVQMTKEWIKNPEIAAGEGWYARMRDLLSKAFGGDHELFSHLLGVTSPMENPVQNFLYALEAYDKYKAGDYDRHISLYKNAIEMKKAGTLIDHVLDVLNKDVPENASGEVTDAGAMAAYIKHHKIEPLRGNGLKYGFHGNGVLQALARTWLEEVKAPKTKNYAGNLFGTTTQATIDTWMARLMRQIGYQDAGKPWRLMPESEKSPSDMDFGFSQLVFDKAAKKLGMNADDLQAICWFGIKDLWEKKGWMDSWRSGAEKSSLDIPFHAAFPSGPKGPRLPYSEVREKLQSLLDEPSEEPTIPRLPRHAGPPSAPRRQLVEQPF